MSDSVEIKGKVESVVDSQINGKPIVKALIKTSKGSSLICLWKADTVPQNLAVGTEYVVSGIVKNVQGKSCMIQPSIKVVTAETTKPKKKKKKIGLVFKILIAVVVIILTGLAITYLLSVRLPTDNSVAPSGSAVETNIVHQDPVPQNGGVTPSDCETLVIPYDKTTKNDNSMPTGTQKVTIKGVNGTKKVCYTNGRDKFPVVTVEDQPVSEVTSIGIAH